MFRRLFVVVGALAILSAACADDAEPDAASGNDAVTDDDATTDDAAATDSADSSTDEPGETVTLVAIGRPEYVSGGDLLVRLTGPDDIEPVFQVGATELSAVGRGGGVYLVSGLPDGPATIEAGGGSLEVVNHPITGPIFSGPHQEPLYCTLEAAELTPTGDDDCSAETEITYGYVDDEGDFVVTDEIPDGVLAIRRERGTINRGIYTFVVADPSLGADPIEPGKHLIYQFGGGCGTGHTQASSVVAGSSVLDLDALEAGYVLATSTFNVFQTHCNDVLSAETLLMVQERVNEMVGPVDLTIGRGGSGGAIQQYSIVQNYPGLLDAVAASVSFPDSSTISGGVTDCGLLLEYYESDGGAALSDEQRLAINGHGSTSFCEAWAATFLPGVSPSEGCDGAVPEEEVYDADSNPDGIRCTLQDSGSNLFGVDENGFGRRPLDNIGVEYGRAALEAGVLSVDAFLDLNEAIGGYDIDGNIVDERTAADPEVVELAYASGRVLRGDSGVNDVPIIDTDLYSDLGYDIHDRFRLFTIRERMELANGGPVDNRVIWTRGGAGLLAVVSGDDPGSISDEDPGTVPTPTEMIDLLAEWATSGERPEGVADDCLINGERVLGDDVFAEGEPCADAYPYHGDPRTAAGQPLSNDIIKCSTVPVDPTSYGVDFSEAQATRLAEVFSGGVCDYSVPGVGQVELEGTWLHYDGSES